MAVHPFIKRSFLLVKLRQPQPNTHVLLLLLLEDERHVSRRARRHGARSRQLKREHRPWHPPVCFVCLIEEGRCAWPKIRSMGTARQVMHIHTSILAPGSYTRRARLELHLQQE